jgi:hypothetical protein
MRSLERLVSVSVMSVHAHGAREIPVGSPARWIVSETGEDCDR